MAHPKKPCTGCPYAKATPPNDLRGRDILRFIAQAYGPFLLPCHKFADKTQWTFDIHAPQCAGAAQFRSAAPGVPTLPPELLVSPIDEKDTFSNPVELLAHHRRCSPQAAFLELRTKGIKTLVQEEIDLAKQQRPNDWNLK